MKRSFLGIGFGTWHSATDRTGGAPSPVATSVLFGVQLWQLNMAADSSCSIKKGLELDT